MNNGKIMNMNGDDEWAGTPFPYRVIICGVFIVAFVYLIMMPFYLYKGRLISEETITADVTIVDGTKHVKTPITMPYEIDIKYGSQYISYYTKDVNEYYKFKKQINHRCKAEMTILKYGTGDVRIEVEKLRIIPKKPTNMKQIRDYPNLYYNLSGHMVFDHMVFEMVYNDDPLPGEPEYKYLPLMCGDKFYYYDPDSNEIFVKK
ncbi:MAG: hypothetical protein ACLUPG_06550 [Roseburia faecis]|jgi:hypothetical protein